MRFLLARRRVAFDHVRRTMTVTGPRAEVERVAAALDQARGGAARRRRSPAGAAAAEMTRAGYVAAVERAKQHIAAGDAFQIVPSQRVRRPTERLAVRDLPRAARGQPVAVHVPARLRRLPADRLLARDARAPGHATAPASCARSRARARAAPTPAADDALAAELLADEKERAEHVMLVDLARNDLGRVCEPGIGAACERCMDVERYSHVMHIVSHVFGQIAAGRDARRRCCGRRSPPARSPARRRCARCRSSPSSRAAAAAPTPARSATSASAATWTRASRCARWCCATASPTCSPAAGIVADSDPDEEYQEAMNKVAALGAAIDRAETGVYGR